MVPRLIEKLVVNALKREKIILILGARQVGKTTLLNSIKDKIFFTKKTLYFNCDFEEDRKTLNTTSFTELKRLIEGAEIVFIDEAQRLDYPGLTLKIIYDNLKVKLIATGSSSFELKNKLSDSLSGRYLDFILYPFSYEEVKDKIYDVENSLLFGFYPEVFLTPKTQDKILLLNKIIESYLFKDILSFQKIRHSQVIKNLLIAVAYQIGSEVNESELSNRLKIDRKTVESYLDILEKSFIIKRLYPYSKNPRREIGRRYKIYFIDLGIRNALIGDFNDVNLRQDSGVMFENFVIIEKLKASENRQLLADYYFWRSYGGGEVDLIEKSKVNGRISAYEIKYRSEKLSKGAAIFSNRYQIKTKVVNTNNYQNFISSLL